MIIALEVASHATKDIMSATIIFNAVLRFHQKNSKMCAFKVTHASLICDHKIVCIHFDIVSEVIFRLHST